MKAAIPTVGLALLAGAHAVTINSYPATAVNVLVNNDAPGTLDDLMPGTNVSASLQQYFQMTLNNTLKIPGGALYVTTPQGTFLKSFGSDTLESYVPFNLENHFRVGSLTKTLVASAVLKLISEGKISLDDTWSKYYDGAQGTFPYADQITVRDLLGMTSGVYNYVRSREALTIQGTDPTLPFSYAQIIEVILKYQPYYMPSDRLTANYSNSNYILLDHIVELTSGGPTASYIDTNFLQPLSLSADTFWPADSYTLGDPHSERYGPWPLTSMTEYGNKTYSNPTQALGAGAYVSNLKSLKTWIEATVSGYGYGGPTSDLHGQRTMGYVHDLGQPLPLNVTFEYGYGLMKVKDYYGHDGSISGFTTMALTNPAKNITLVAVGNTGPTGITIKNGVEMLAMIDPDFLSGSTAPSTGGSPNPPNSPNTPDIVPPNTANVNPPNTANVNPPNTAGVAAMAANTATPQNGPSGAAGLSYDTKHIGIASVMAAAVFGAVLAFA